MEDMETSGLQGDAAYEQIRAYVKSGNAGNGDYRDIRIF